MDNLIRELVSITRDVIASEIDINGCRYICARHIISVEYEEFVNRLDGILAEANQLYQDDKQLLNEYVGVVDEWVKKAIFKSGAILQKLYANVKKKYGDNKAALGKALTDEMKADPDLEELAIYLAGAPTILVKTGKRLEKLREEGETINKHGEEIIPREIARPYIEKLYKKEQQRIGTVWRMFRDIALGGFKDMGTAQDWAKDMAKQAFLKRERVREQKEFLDRGYAREFFEYLPKQPLRITLDASSGNLLAYHNRFRGQGEELKVDVMASAEQMKWLIKNWNDIVQKVYSDITGNDHFKGVVACITGLIIETGLRPGRFGNGIVKRVDGRLENVDTFGAVTMLMKHMEMHVRKGFAIIEFLGKKGTLTRARVDDRNVNLTKILWHMIHRMARVTGQADEIEPPKKVDDKFFTHRGKSITYHQVWEYFKKTFGRITPTTFRKLKATQEVYDSLKGQQRNLLQKVKKVKVASESVYENAVITEVTNALKTAFEKAQDALSHKKVETSVDRYVNPTVVMGFLSGAGLGKKLEDLIGYGGKIIVKFDAREFAKQVIPRTPREKESQAVVEIEYSPGAGGLEEVEAQLEREVE